VPQPGRFRSPTLTRRRTNAGPKAIDDTEEETNAASEATDGARLLKPKSISAM
jgi:hypothetical protein